MNETDILKQYYEGYDEEGRLLSNHGQVEYITTQKYIHACAEKVNANRILEVGAGTGRYSVPLAKEGFHVTAVELIEHNLAILRQKLTGGESVTAVQGNALDLFRFSDGSFDLTLLLGPMYHLFTFQDKQKALSEAVRVTKPGGYVLVSYCMNEPTVIQYVFRQGHLPEVLEKDMLTADWHCTSVPAEVFELGCGGGVAKNWWPRTAPRITCGNISTARTISPSGNGWNIILPHANGRISSAPPTTCWISSERTDRRKL